MTANNLRRSLFWYVTLLGLQAVAGGRVGAAESLEERLAGESRNLHQFLAGDSHPRAKAAFSKCLASLQETANQKRLASAREAQDRQLALREDRYDRQAQRVAMVYAAQQACLAEYNRYQAYYYRVYSAPTYRSYSRTYTVSVPR